MASDAPLLCVPAEIRLIIYKYLLAAAGNTRIIIRNRPKHVCKQFGEQKTRRTAYPMLERSMGRRHYQATYCFQGEDIHLAILAVNRLIRDEASYYLYNIHTFDFGSDLEAVVPFLSDKTLATRALIQDVALHKSGPMSTIDTDSYSWAAACRFIQTLPGLKKLRIIVGGGRPQVPWDGPQQLSVSDLRLLYSTHHESLEWVRELAGIEAVCEIEVGADMRHMPQPTSTSTLIFAAFSASIETSFIEFLQTDLHITTRALSSSEKAAMGDDTN